MCGKVRLLIRRNRVIFSPISRPFLTVRSYSRYNGAIQTTGVTPMRVPLVLLQIAFVVILPLRLGFAQEQVASPIFQDGDTWQFKMTNKGFNGPSSVSTRTYEIAYTNGDVQVYVFGDKGKQKADSNARDYFLGMIGKAETEGRKAFLQFPLFVGKEWHVEYDIKPGSRRLLMGGNIKVTKIEDISTVAGNFRSFKIEREDRGMVAIGVGDLWNWSFTSTFHYSPEARSIVKLHWETSGDAPPE